MRYWVTFTKWGKAISCGFWNHGGDATDIARYAQAMGYGVVIELRRSFVAALGE